ncbi:hypothetical protein Psal073_00514 [Piscirickettsia salmonis]|uniref:hypothetical protein n=1 Tax=Piscirickettsia salmonis TaxID=1238 RepID=UPI0012B9B5C9|nr:hypothetical protein [Piscirickettsia salmonis]QGO65589.1 hypothetical protein Psal073_00514 [Piscirickettsia salmonis]
MPISKKLKKQIEGFNPKTLRSLPVYTASVDRHTGTFIKTHGFLVTGIPGSNKPRDMGRVYHLGSSIMHAPYKITDQVITAAKSKLNLCGNKITEKNIIFLEKLKGLTVSPELIDIFSKLKEQSTNKKFIEHMKNFKGKTITHKLISDLCDNFNEKSWANIESVLVLQNLIGVKVSEDTIKLLTNLQNNKISTEDFKLIQTLEGVSVNNKTLADLLPFEGCRVNQNIVSKLKKYEGLTLDKNDIKELKQSCIDDKIDLPKEALKFLDNLAGLPMTKNLLTLAEKLSESRITLDTVQALEQMKGDEYLTVESMLRALLAEKCSVDGEEICFDKEIGLKEYNYLLATHPNDELKEVVSLNKAVNKERGAIVYRLPTSKRAREDHLDFQRDNSSISYKKLSGVTEARLRDSFNRQALGMRYLDMQAGIGKSVEFKDKKQVHSQDVERVKECWYKHEFTPDSNKKQGNCNVSSSTLAESASYSAFLGNVAGVSVENGSRVFGYGHNQRMKLWNPLGSLMQLKSIETEIPKKIGTPGKISLSNGSKTPNNVEKDKKTEPVGSLIDYLYHKETLPLTDFDKTVFNKVKQPIIDYIINQKNTTKLVELSDNVINKNNLLNTLFKNFGGESDIALLKFLSLLSKNKDQIDHKLIEMLSPHKESILLAVDKIKNKEVKAKFLTEIIDATSALGAVFYHKRGVRAPSITRGRLKEALAMLKSIKNKPNVFNDVGGNKSNNILSMKRPKHSPKKNATIFKHTNEKVINRQRAKSFDMYE